MAHACSKISNLAIRLVKNLTKEFNLFTRCIYVCLSIFSKYLQLCMFTMLYVFVLYECRYLL